VTTPTGAAARMGFKPGTIVQELGYDEDVDLEFRDELEELIGEELLDEDSDEVVDVVLFWFRDGDGDLVDDLVDAIAPLADEGCVWLLTPKRGKAGYVEPSDISEAAPIAGLTQTSLATVGSSWSGARLASRRAAKGGR
jgi:hypothetical protein